MAFLLAGEARYGKWLIAGDYVYLNLGNVSSHTNTHNFGPGPVQIVDTGSDTSLKTTIWSIVGGYAVVSTPAATVDLIAGVRYLGEGQQQLEPECRGDRAERQCGHLAALGQCQ
ncbi:MAG: hypothetical protein IPN75_09080 [Dechloromonas sp.]|uniref:Uncharacterized protein n=1 Tax=Candidatus Dechloromonas phosphorivorans TaxID=2899244 RepID=A0A9D7LUF7_9RHOO|nr:hypothetical protein [Candidatus Dechloromonas phosphorivorans]